MSAKAQFSLPGRYRFDSCFSPQLEPGPVGRAFFIPAFSLKLPHARVLFVLSDGGFAMRLKSVLLAAALGLPAGYASDEAVQINHLDCYFNDGAQALVCPDVLPSGRAAAAWSINRSASANRPASTRSITEASISSGAGCAALPPFAGATLATSSAVRRARRHGPRPTARGMGESGSLWRLRPIVRFRGSGSGVAAV